MSKGKLKYKKIIFAFLMVSILFVTFTLPCSGEEVNKYFNPTNKRLSAYYSLSSDENFDEFNGPFALSYEGSITIGSLSFLSYGDVPFNVGSISDVYRLEVYISGLNVGLDKVDTLWNVYTRYAIGNGTSIFSLYECAMYIESSDGVQSQKLDQVIQGNVAYVSDTIEIYSTGSYNIKLVFDFPRTDWSNSNHLYLFGFNFTRQITAQEVINNQTDTIINSTTDKNNQANSNAESELNNIQNFEDGVINQMDNVFNQIPDIALFENEVLGVTTTGNIMLAVFNGFGDKFVHLWWILSTIGILSTFIGLLIKRKKE